LDQGRGNLLGKEEKERPCLRSRNRKGRYSSSKGGGKRLLKNESVKNGFWVLVRKEVDEPTKVGKKNGAESQIKP